jgi:acetoin utilization deacetylase AcuC-like enzyme
MTGNEYPKMRVWSHHRWQFPLPAHHKFPLAKYELLAERVVEDGLVAPGDVLEPEPVDWEDLAEVHDCGLLSRIREGCLTAREARGLGLPWSEELVERGRRSVGGTVEAAFTALETGVAMNLGGGTHHAGRDFSRGYCLFNDVAVALALLRREDEARAALIVDCDVHQGDGTAHIFADDPRTFTLSLHGARNYPFQRLPSDLDVDIATGTGDTRYLRALGEALDFALERSRPYFAFYLAGADPRVSGWAGSRSPRTGCGSATSWSWIGFAPRASTFVSCSAADMPMRSETPWTSTPPPPRPSRRGRVSSQADQLGTTLTTTTSYKVLG